MLAGTRLSGRDVAFRAGCDIQIVEKVFFLVVRHSDGTVTVGWMKRMERSRVQGTLYLDLSALGGEMNRRTGVEQAMVATQLLGEYRQGRVSSVKLQSLGCAKELATG